MVFTLFLATGVFLQTGYFVEVMSIESVYVKLGGERKGGTLRPSFQSQVALVSAPEEASLVLGNPPGPFTRWGD